MSNNKFKLTGIVRAIDSSDYEKMGVSKAAFMSQASSLFPKEVDVSESFDLLPVVFNLGVVNKFNANGDGIDTVRAAQIIKRFIHKPLNIEHYKPDIVGHIVNASFTDKEPDYLENSVEDFLDREDPFFISVAAVIYKHVYPDLSKAIMKASNPEDPSYQAYSSSWEIAFSKYKVCVGSKLLSECDVYEEGTAEYEKYDKELKSSGGKGGNKSEPVSRLFDGKIIPVGAALTENPAAEVKGVYSLVDLINKEDQEKTSNSNKKSSQNEETPVNDKNDNSDIMTEEQFNELKKHIEDQIGSFDINESTASTVGEKFATVLEDAAKDWKSSSEAAKEREEDYKKEMEDLKKQLASATESLVALKSDLEMRKAAEKYNGRMEAMASVFELNEEVEAIVAKQIKDIETDEDFESYLTEAKILFADKTKEAIAAVEAAEKAEKKNDEIEESKASEEEGEGEEAEGEAEEAEAEGEEEKEGEDEIETSESSDSCVTNNNGDDSTEENLFDRLKKAGLQLENK